MNEKISINRYWTEVPFFCFPVGATNGDGLIKGLEILEEVVRQKNGLMEATQHNFTTFQEHAQAPLALVVTGGRDEEVLKEIQLMKKGVPLAFEKKIEWKTPRGSYFTPEPLGTAGKVSFVYPGVGSAYIGLGRDLFQLFPGLYDQFAQITPDVDHVLKVDLLYPSSPEGLTEDQIKQLEYQLRKDISALSECGVAFSALYTMVLRKIFKINPGSALGYSLGEAAMIASLGVWSNPGDLSARLQESPIFKSRLVGKLEAVREQWGVDDRFEGPLWESYTLRASPESVKEAIQNEERVYLTFINTPKEVVIGGDPKKCLPVIKQLGCASLPLQLSFAIHCEPAYREYDRLVDLYTLPLSTRSGIKFYSSSCYQPVPFRGKAIANSIAKAFCEPVDFPRLVNRVYDDGVRIFIEAGAQQFCSKWIDEILKDKPHVAIPINVKGVRDHVAIIRALARLMSHRVSVDLSILFK